MAAADAPVTIVNNAASGGGFNINWDGAWQVATRVTDSGWHAEIAIPFRTLRYPRTDVQSWGMNFQRNIRAQNEQSYWSPLPRQYDLNRISAAGELQGLRVPPHRNLQLTPYMLGQALHRTESSSNLQTGDIGADLKYSVTPSMTLDLTLNTDFAQVEVDDEQVNLDRFNLFFPEKRPFFLENAGLFSVGQSGAVDIFFSRSDRTRRRPADPDHRWRPPVGQGRNEHQRRVSQHADAVGRRDRKAATELHRWTCQAGFTEPLERRRHLRQSAGHR